MLSVNFTLLWTGKRSVKDRYTILIEVNQSYCRWRHSGVTLEHEPMVLGQVEQVANNGTDW